MRKSFKWFVGNILYAEVKYEGSWPRAVLVSCEDFQDERVCLPLLRRTSAELNHLFESRVQPRHLFDSYSAAYYGVDRYDAEKMCRATHGAMPHDTFWMQFEDDPELCWEDVDVS